MMDLHECHGTETKREVVNDEGRTWKLCVICHQWWVCSIVNLRAANKVKMTGTMKRSEGDTQNGR
jgi:hypothetical protein